MLSSSVDKSVCEKSRCLESLDCMRGSDCEESSTISNASGINSSVAIANNSPAERPSSVWKVRGLIPFLNK